MTEESLSDEQVRNAERKFGHAVWLLDQLRAGIIDWNSSGHFTIAPVQLDPRTIVYRQRVTGLPPIDGWSLTLGDALHNFRSSLDALAWEIANLDPSKPPRLPKRIYFPTATDEKNWNERWVPDLADIRQPFLDRMRSVQAFDNPSAANSVLLDLHQLDIDDKHRGLLNAIASFDMAEFELNVGPPEGQATITGTLSPMEFPDRHVLRDGNSVGGYTADTDVVLLSDKESVALVVPTIELRDMRLRVTDFASQIGVYVRFTIDVVRFGAEEALRLGIERGYAELIEAPRG